MDREIKFRAWFMDKKLMDFVAMHNVYPGNTSYFYLSPMPMSDYEPIKLMQWTGLKDKNGKEIYEGDICDDGKNIFEVVWSECHQWGCKVIKGGNLVKGLVFPLWQMDKEFEVIGNIYENPELLEGAANEIE